MSVMSAVGKPKPNPLKRLDKQAEEPAAPPQDKAPHDEPDADQMGGPSANDADNQIAENVETVTAAVPELAHPIGAMFEALANYCRQHKGGEP